jgi:hypothetical protein
MFDKAAEVEQGGERWLQERREFRAAARLQLQRREGLPSHDGERYAAKDGKSYGLAIGQRKGVGAGKPIAEGFLEAVRDTEFNHLFDNSAALARELADLERDAASFRLAEGVKHLGEKDGPILPNNVLSDEESLDRWLQGELERKRML